LCGSSTLEKEEIINCNSKFYERSYSPGLIPAYPLALGVMVQAHSNNFGASVLGMYLPGVRKYDDPKIPDDLNNNNHTTNFFVSVNYNYPLFRCKKFPNIGIFAVVRTR
jgi:hypothetical protein